MGGVFQNGGGGGIKDGDANSGLIVNNKVIQLGSNDPAGSPLLHDANIGIGNFNLRLMRSTGFPVLLVNEDSFTIGHSGGGNFVSAFSNGVDDEYFSVRRNAGWGNSKTFYVNAGTNKVAIGGNQEPTSLLHIAAGTVDYGQVRLDPGVLKTVPEAGNVEFDGISFYATKKDGAGNRQLILNNINSTSLTFAEPNYPAPNNNIAYLFGYDDGVVQNSIGVLSNGIQTIVKNKSTGIYTSQLQTTGFQIFGTNSASGFNAINLYPSFIGVGMATTNLGFFTGSASSGGASKQIVSGSRGGNAALASLLTALANYGLITNSTTV